MRTRRIDERNRNCKRTTRNLYKPFGKVKRIYGLYLVSDTKETNLKNRDVNASVSMVQIATSLRDFGEMPREFRKEIQLKQESAYNNLRTYTYKAKSVNEYGQIDKFSRKKVERISDTED